MSYTEILSITVAVIVALVFLFFLTRKNTAAKSKQLNPSIVHALSAYFNGDDNTAIVELKKIVYDKKTHATPEIYLILGFLERRKGDFTRASQIHEMLLGNTELDTTFKNALFGELAKDYMYAGQYAKAVNLLKTESQILNQPENLITMARSALALQSYDNALLYHTKYNKLTGKVLYGFFEKCMVSKAVNSNNLQSAMKYIKSALEVNKQCRPARIIKALILLNNNKVQKSCDEFKLIIEQGLLRDINDYKNVEKAFITAGKEAELINFMKEQTSQGALNPFTHIAVANMYELNDDIHGAKNTLELYIEQPNSKIIAAKEYAVKYNNKLLLHTLENIYSYKCKECGYETNEYKDDCPNCNAYDSIYPK